MKTISRRQLLRLSAILSVCYPVSNLGFFAVAGDKKNGERYPLTLDILKEAYWAEMVASNNYDKYCQKALSEDYPNIAYLFFAFSISERIHADNYQELINSLGSTPKAKEFPDTVADTKANLNIAATKELEKINVFYPEILNKLACESHDQAVINCMYSWKSHQQHEEMINDIRTFSGIFFKPLAMKIESMKPNYYVCEICGSTMDEKPEKPCLICNYPMSHFKRCKRP